MNDISLFSKQYEYPQPDMVDTLNTVVEESEGQDFSLFSNVFVFGELAALSKSEQ